MSVETRTAEGQPSLISENSPLLVNPVSPEIVDSKEDKMGVLETVRGFRIPVYILVMLFALSSWVDINGLWVEMPLMVNKLPEGWNLPSYLVIIIQIANIGPLAYMVANRLAPNRVKEWPVIYLIIAIGLVSVICLAFSWTTTAVIGGNEHSISLLLFASLLALVDCTSSVVYLPYMVIFKHQYMTALYIGEGLSGLIPGLVGLIQGVGGDPDCRNVSDTIYNETTGENYTIWQIKPFYDPPLFSVEVFLFFLAGMLCVSVTAFSFVNFLPYCQQEKVHNHAYDVTTEEYVTYDKPMADVDQIDDKGIIVVPDNNTDSHMKLSDKVNRVSRDDDGRDLTKQRLTGYQFIFLMVLVAWLNGLTNGVIPSTQSYSSLPYGNRAYTLSVRLSAVANPLACFVALFLPTGSLTVLAALSFFGCTAAGYQLYLAAVSPFPPLQGEASGEAILILTAVVMTGLFSYVKVSIATILRFEGRKALLWCGGLTQVGSFVGAVIIFILVNVLKLFQDMPPCGF